MDASPPPDVPYVAAKVALGVAMYGATCGVPPQETLGAMGLRVEELSNQARVSAIQAAKGWEFLDERLPGRPLGLEFARFLPEDALGVVQFAARHAATARDRFRTWERYMQVLTKGIELELDGDVVVVRRPQWMRSPTAVEVTMGLAVRFTPALTGGIVGVSFRHAARGPESVYEERFGAPVEFQAEANTMRLRAEALDRPCVTALPPLFEALQGRLDAALAEVKARHPDAEDPLHDVRVAVAQLGEDGAYTAEELARSLGTSVRSLQRRVRGSGTTVRALLDEHREATARHLLQLGELSLDDTAFLVGYADERSFSRAFKRWTGQTPAQYRNAAG